MKKFFGLVLVLTLLGAPSGAIATFASATHQNVGSLPSTTHRASTRDAAGDESLPKVPATTRAKAGQAQGAIIVDHTCTDISAIPQEWIEEAKQTLHIGYGHTSHGSQLTSGMTGLVNFANSGGLGLSLPEDIFSWNRYGTGGALDLREGDGYGSGDLDHDCGYYPDWVDETREYLGTPDPGTGRGTDNPDINVIIWSWCGQASGRTEQTMLDTYLLPMTQLEEDYPGVTFVYMTGHADGTGEQGNLHLRNQQIRNYCIANNKVLYDFYDIECYDPDGHYYGDKSVEDDCGYDSDGNGSIDSNWAIDWQNSHTEGSDWYDCSCAHSQALNCNQKAYATWWLWARLAGWSSTGPQKTASPDTAVHGQTITYTIVVQNLTAPLTATVYLTDTVPAGLSYLPGTLTATEGTANEDDAPTLRWSGILTPTPAVTVTYAVAVSATTHQVITNTAVIAAPGYQTLTRTATVTVELAPDQPDLTPSYKAVSSPYADHGERVVYTVVVRNSTGPLTNTVLFTDTIQDGLVYVPGTLTATTGIVTDADAPTLRWSGILTPTSDTTITYAATVTYVLSGTATVILPQVITNTAFIVTPGHPPVIRTATVRTNWQQLYLPLMLRSN